MFVLANDGGTPQNVDCGDALASSIINQRAFLFEISKQGLAFALLRGAEYRDSKV